MILLDTNVVVRLLRGDDKVRQEYIGHLGDIAIPAMVLGELYLGIEKSDAPQRNLRLLNTLRDSLPVLHTNDLIMETFGVIKARLQKSGTPIEDADLLIAATAMVYKAPLITGNIRHFSRISGLEIQTW